MPFQEKLNPVVQNFVNEVNNNSQLETMAYELLDGIGPRLIGTPEMLAANEWTANKLKSWDIEASLQQFGTWKGWQRGITHVDMTFPRMKSLSATQLAWSPATKKRWKQKLLFFRKSLPKLNLIDGFLREGKSCFDGAIPENRSFRRSD
jgi:hypothetical protein